MCLFLSWQGGSKAPICSVKRLVTGGGDNLVKIWRWGCCLDSAMSYASCLEYWCHQGAYSLPSPLLPFPSCSFPPLPTRKGGEWQLGDRGEARGPHRLGEGRGVVSQCWTSHLKNSQLLTGNVCNHSNRVCQWNLSWAHASMVPLSVAANVSTLLLLCSWVNSWTLPLSWMSQFCSFLPSRTARWSFGAKMRTQVESGTRR